MYVVTQFAVALILLSLSPILVAQRAAAQESRPPLQNGTWDLSVSMAAATGEETRNSFVQAQIWTAGVFLGRVITNQMGRGWRRGAIELGFDFVPVFVQSGLETIHGVGFDPVVFRWNSSQHLGRALPYIELAGGSVVTDSNLPPGNTSGFNFMVRGGGGVHIFTKRRQSLDLACHYYHVSNANLGSWNPEFNGVQMGLGYHWFK